MAVLYSNNASSALSASITNSATSFSVTAGHGAKFPAITNSDYFYATLVSTGGAIEIVKVTARSTDTFTVVRGQDGTTGTAFTAGDKVELRITKAMLDDYKGERLALTGGTMSGAISFSNVTGNKLAFYNTGTDKYGIDVQSSELRIFSGAQGDATGGITFGKHDGTTFTESFRILNSGGLRDKSGMTAWGTTTPGTGAGNYHIGIGSSTSNSGGAITFGARDANNGTTAQAGIYITSDGTYGTRMYLATTDSYATGAKTAISISELGNVGITRGALQISGAGITSPNGTTVVAADSAMPSAASSLLYTLAYGPSTNDGHILGMTWSGGNSVYGAQLWIDTDPTRSMAFRQRSNAGVWNSWNYLIHDGNYSGYSAFSGTISTSHSSQATVYLGGISSSWGGTAYPTLYGSSTERWVMHINPHISYVANGSNGYTGSMTGATIRFASNTTASTYWDVGVGTNGVGADKFSIGRAANSFLSIDNGGTVYTRAGGYYGAVTSLGWTAPIQSGETNVGASGGVYIPYISQTSLSNSGYRQHTVFGSYRGQTWGSAFIAVGGNDAYPTDAFFFSYGGDITTAGGKTYIHSSNIGSYTAGGANSLEGYAWMSSGKSVRANEFYADGWLRNYNSNTGLYNEATANHFYSDGNYWNVGYNGTTGIRLRQNHAGPILGYYYAETTGNSGLLNNNGNWSVHVYPNNTGGNLENGTWSANGGTITSSGNSSWVRAHWAFYGVGSIQYYNTYNVSSISRTATGSYQVTLAAATSSSSACILGGGGRYGSTATNTPMQGPLGYGSGSSLVYVFTGSNTSTLGDWYDIYGAVLRN